jgi:hypothetical protein
MSTIPNPPAKTEPETARARTPKKPRDRKKASFRYGYRYQRKKLPNGRVDYEFPTPLTQPTPVACSAREQAVN